MAHGSDLTTARTAAEEPIAAIGLEPRHTHACGHLEALHISRSRVDSPQLMLLAFGIMDLRAMAVVTAAISAERLAPSGERVARATGALAVAVGLLLIARAGGIA